MGGSFFTHGQQALGDRHVYASRTRFIPPELLPLFERVSWPVIPPLSAGGTAAAPKVKVDIAARMRGMWS
jgi:DNA helicase-2/ATP-dependent DNA helicase PcrA